MNVENAHGQIEADNGDLHGGCLLGLGLPEGKPIVALRCREREPSTSSSSGRSWPEADNT